MEECEKQEQLKCKMLGGFSLRYNQREIILKCNETSKVMQLFLRLLYAGNEGIAKVKLLEDLYEREEIQDSKNALRILMFRLKKLLQDTGILNGDYIRTEKGNCFFGGPIEVEIDVNEFLKAAADADKEIDNQEKIDALRRACELYTGEFLPQLATEEWVTIESLRCKDLYVRCLTILYGLLEKKGEYEEMLALTSRAAELYPFDDWQTMKIDCLIALNRYKDALKLYEKTTTLFFEELGLSPSEKMLSQFKTMSGRIQHAAGNLNHIQDGLREDTYTGGAYYCSYPSFVDSYRVIARIIERTGTSVFLMLCTLTDSKEQPLEKEDVLEEEMSNLGDAIESSLRRGDCYTKYSTNQFLILLQGIAQENCSIISDRITQNYKKKFAGHRVGLAYSMSSIVDVEKSGGII